MVLRNDESPVMEKMPFEVKQKLRKLRTRSAFPDDREDDEVFIAEGILKRENDKYLVKFVGYEPEWMDMGTIPSFILEHFHKTGNTNIPRPHILSSSTTGNTVYNTLTWTMDLSLPRFIPSMDTLFLGHGTENPDQVDGPLRCNTKKDKDSRFHRHTAGIMVGCWPCGICVLWDELYGTESISQVYGIITDWLRWELQGEMFNFKAFFIAPFLQLLETASALPYTMTCVISRVSQGLVL